MTHSKYKSNQFAVGSGDGTGKWWWCGADAGGVDWGGWVEMVWWFPGVHGDSAICSDGIVKRKDSMTDHGSRDDGIMGNDVLLFRMV